MLDVIISKYLLCKGLSLPAEEVKNWNRLGSIEFNPSFAREEVINDNVTTGYEMINSLIASHLKHMSFRFPFNLDASIRHVIKSLVQLISTLVT